MKKTAVAIAVAAICAGGAAGGDWFHPDAEPEAGVAIMDDPHSGPTPPVARRNFVQAGTGTAATPEVVRRVRRWNAAVGFSAPEARYDVNFPKSKPMPCLTDPAVLAKIVADFRAWKAKNHPKSHAYFRLCCNDTGKWCECDRCKSLMTPDRGLTGIASDYWWTFVNALAEELLADPLVSLDAFAYRNYQDFPRKVRPVRRPRLSVVLCPHGRCYTHSLNDAKCPRNGRYLAMFRQWADERIPINTFEYFNQTPGRCNYVFWERAWIEDVKWYAKNGISHGDGNFLGPWAGMRRQDNYYRNNAARARWQIAWLTAYFDAHPDADFDSVRSRLFAAYYRAAARPMTAYHDLLEKAFLDSGVCMEYGLGRNLFFLMASRPGLLPKARELLAEARSLAAGDAELARRIGWDAEYFRTNLEWCGFDAFDLELAVVPPATLDDFRLCRGAGDVPMKRAEKYPKKTSARISREGAKIVVDISGDEGGEFRIQYLTEKMKGTYRDVPAKYGRNEIDVGDSGLVRLNVARNEKGAKKPYGSASGYPWFIPDYWFVVRGGRDASSVPKVMVGDGAADRIAAEEFVRYYALMTGARPEIVDREEGGGAFVKIGRSFAEGLSFDDKFDSYRIKSTKEGGAWHLLLAGGNERSTMYAVYEFYKSLGCRWFWDGDRVPRTGTVDLSGQDVYEVSAFEWRGTRYFAHRGLRRFSAEMWGPDDWRREIDWLLKNRLNFFFFRLGTDDLFQKAFPEHCKYPDASKPLPGQLKGYDNRSLFWPLQYRGALRKKLTDYAFARGLMIPPDFGTITHWYTRTPQDFLDGAKPEFIPEPARGYAANDSGKIWDVRKDKWLEAYWKITEAEIANYGRTPGPLHTIGFSERNIYENRADNFRLKKETTQRMFDRALKSYPNATILFAGWDFYSTWTAEEVRDYLPTLDPKHVVILDYEGNAYREKIDGRHSIFTEWDLVGKFPYVFGTFFYESGTPIHTDYALINKRRAVAMSDPMCKGCVLWPEASHVDLLEQFEFVENAWRFANKPVDSLIDAFCADRYGEHAAAFADLWRKVVPISVAVADNQGVWRANYADLVYTYLANPHAAVRPEYFPARGRKAFAAAPSVFRGLAAMPRGGEWLRRDAADLARTVGDRLVMEAACEAQLAWFAWRDGKTDAGIVLALADATIGFVDLLGRVLALHGDFSLNDTLAETRKIERIRLPDFDRVLLQNAVNPYCISHQAEPAAHLYPAMYRMWRDEIAAKLAAGDRSAELHPEGVRELVEKLWERRLADLRPEIARSDANWRSAMLDFAAAAEAWLALPQK